MDSLNNFRGLQLASIECFWRVQVGIISAASDNLIKKLKFQFAALIALT